VNLNRVLSCAAFIRRGTIVPATFMPDGAKGGPVELSQHPFFIGINDPSA
jgi:hypothetical protein